MDHEKFAYRLFYTQYKGHAGEIARTAVERNIAIVCAVGGDGSAHEVGINLIHSNTKLAIIIPRGSGNGISNHMGIPIRTIRAIKCLNKYFSISIDTVSVNNSHFLGVGGYGIDAFIAKNSNNTKSVD